MTRQIPLSVGVSLSFAESKINVLNFYLSDQRSWFHYIIQITVCLIQHLHLTFPLMLHIGLPEKDNYHYFNTNIKGRFFSFLEVEVESKSEIRI